MRYVFKLSVLAVLAVAAGGCLEEKSEYFLNPDGSGKVIYESYILSMDMGMGMAAPAQDPNAKVAETLQTITTQSKGVDAWKNVSCNAASDGRIHFKGTAYFRDINKLAIQNKMLKFPMKRNEGGQIVIAFDTENTEQFGGEEIPANLSDEEIEKRIEKSKAEYNQSRMMVAAFMPSLKLEAILHLPGTIAEASNFERIDDKTVRVAIEGQKLLAVMDAIMNDDQLLREQLKAGKKMTDDDAMMNEKLFGQKAPVQVVVNPASENVFDYEAELAMPENQTMDIETGEPNDGAADVNEAKADYSRSIDEQFNDVFVKLRSKDLQAAVDILRGIIVNKNATSKDMVKAYDRLGTCYLRMEDEAKATEQFEAIIAKFPEEKMYVAKAKKSLSEMKKEKLPKPQPEESQTQDEMIPPIER